mmetsp:Transcript_1207/g.2634  ORF Transcript_1207/g.2634 Transcript_1207/m.2634 type:complete len:269 (+) Transcript_1207:117-923(+)|eukprot:CAMPEP_0206459848 /NCGR_PEP_ID=MMETSP0324_2-20121206/24416_1 /ASSEMBLY_ACC=CAM_ASM_000836 /TAXON_ID=2866 /ORGANISM="Crypthecodinium cohnii, Strain Seligo" /LENGTH=268 /DNA_ID=CAMNT_0053931469 /DNA_START=82 /DNA_END=888 /DNA_ORIENTATION=+
MADEANSKSSIPPVADAILKDVAAAQQGLKTKKTFVTSCRSLTTLAEETAAAYAEHSMSPDQAVSAAMLEAGSSVRRILRTRYTEAKYWQAGLDFFLALEFHWTEQVPDAGTWRDEAMQEVDEEAREQAKVQAKLRREQEDKMHNKGRWSDANTMISQEVLLASHGLILVEDEGRPGMSRDARDELRVVTVYEEELCVVCQEPLIPGSKAKAMPCGHKFHDECLDKWVQKSNSCPTCRFDELPSEKRHFDDIQRTVQQSGPGRSGVYS